MELRSLYKKIKLQGINSTGITKSISDYIVENIKQRNIEALSLKKIAKNCNVSDATITRYCKELGYSGFIPFKKHLDAINTNYVINNHEVIINRSLVESTEKFYDEYVNIYNRGRLAIKMLIKNGMVDRIASLLKNCQRIFIAGNNINYSQTIDFKNHLIASGFNVLLEQDEVAVTSFANIATKNDVFITISLAGTDTFLESAGQCAKSNGAQWIAITSVSDSVFQNADQLIVLESKEWNIWNLYSLRGQMLFEFWNVIYLATVHKLMEAENYEKTFDSYQETDDLSNLKIKM